MPFVKKSSRALERVKDKVARLALLQTLRQIRSETVHAIICAVLSVVMGMYLMDASSRSDTAKQNIFQVQRSFPAGVDTVILPKNTDQWDTYLRFSDTRSVPSSLADTVREIEGVKSVGTLSVFHNYGGGREDHGTSSFTEYNPHTDLGGSWDRITVVVADEVTLPSEWSALREGDPDALFSDPYAAVYMIGEKGQNMEKTSVGAEFGLLSSMTYSHVTPQIPEDVPRFHVVAVVSADHGTGDVLIVNPEGAEAIGLIGTDECHKLYVSFADELTEEEKTELSQKIASLPVMLRYTTQNERYLTESEKGVGRANSIMFGLFLSLLFLSFCVMTYMQSHMKTLRSRRDFAIERQLGATDAEIYKKMRVGTYPSAVLALTLDFVVMTVLSVSHVMGSMAELNIQADMFPMTYTPEFYARCRREIFEAAAVPLLLLLGSLIPQLICALAAVLGTVFPTRRLLREPVTEGLRKDTD